MSQMGFKSMRFAARLVPAVNRVASASPSLSTAVAWRLYQALDFSSQLSLHPQSVQGPLDLRCFTDSSTQRCGVKKTEPTLGHSSTRGPPSNPPADEEQTLASVDTSYQAAADLLLEGLAEQLQEVQDTCGLDDVDYRDGVLKIVCENGVNVILNKHYVTKQIWYASPLSGAQYFDFSLGWVCARTGTELVEAMRRDLEQATGKSLPAFVWPEGSRKLKGNKV